MGLKLENAFLSIGFHPYVCYCSHIPVIYPSPPLPVTLYSIFFLSVGYNSFSNPN